MKTKQERWYVIVKNNYEHTTDNTLINIIQYNYIITARDNRSHLRKFKILRCIFPNGLPYQLYIL